MRSSPVNGSVVERLLGVKEKVLCELENMLSKDRVGKARRDPHSKRAPRPCGVTVHPALGCSFGCVYCYVPSMGFEGRPRVYPLSGEQLVYALALNPYLVPGEHGTLIAIGSVTEPFMNPAVTRRTIEYVGAIKRWLGNPIQAATKSVVSENDARELARACEGRMSVLISITTLKLASKLEPGAPPPKKRLGSSLMLSRLGLKVCLFMRPIIPGVTDTEAQLILAEALHHGMTSVVPGSLRVTPLILRRLQATGIPMGEIRRRMPREPRSDKDQVTLRMSDLKEKITSTARSLGMTVHPSSCSANIEAHDQACWACNMGPCGNPGRLPRVSEEGVEDAVQVLGASSCRAWVGENKIVVEARGLSRERARIVEQWITTLSRRMVVVKRI